MSPAFTQRRAERFARQVNQPVRSHAQGEDADLLDLVAALRDLPDVQPRAEFSRALRARLMVEADTALVASSRAAHAVASREAAVRQRRTNRRLAALVGAVALSGASASVAMAAQSSLPGDALYPIKGVVEGARGVTSRDDGAAQLDRARERLSEAMALSTRGDADAQREVGPTLDRFTEQADGGADAVLAVYADSRDAADIEPLREFVTDSRSTLLSLQTVAPADAADELDEALAAVTTIQDRITQACPDCDAVVGATTAPAPALPPDGPVTPPGPAPTAAPDRSEGAKPRAGQPEVVLPDVDPDSLPPGSVSQGEAPAPGPGTVDTPRVPLDPVRDLTSGVDRTTDGVEDVVTSVTEPVRDLGGLLGLESVTDPLGDTVDGATGSLLP